MFRLSQFRKKGSISSCGFLVPVLLTFMLSISSFAGDGQIDILPNGSETFVISKSGSYVLTDNVVMTADVHCIDITAAYVCLDMNGHTIQGGQAPTKSGIKASSSEGIRIINGSVLSFGSYGIYLGDDAEIQNVKVVSNGNHGIYVKDGAKIKNVKALNNKACGINTGSEAIVEQCHAKGNNAIGYNSGISVAKNSIVRNCIAEDNSYKGTEWKPAHGISAWDSCLIEKNVCKNNTNSSAAAGTMTYGIFAADKCIIKDNVCCNNSGENGVYATGIGAGSQCVITANNCSGNESTGASGRGQGISCGSYCNVTDNICTYNRATAPSGGMAFGISIGSWSIVRGNICSFNKTNGPSSAMGINCVGNQTRIENNHCMGNTGSIVNDSAGIFVYNSRSDCVIINNTTSGNTKGIRLSNGSHYCAENMCTDDIVETTSVTMGTGDRANVLY
jgi:parallel beta-helix repeat protein